MNVKFQIIYFVVQYNLQLMIQNFNNAHINFYLISLLLYYYCIKILKYFAATSYLFKFTINYASSIDP